MLITPIKLSDNRTFFNSNRTAFTGSYIPKKEVIQALKSDKYALSAIATGAAGVVSNTVKNYKSDNITDIKDVGITHFEQQDDQTLFVVTRNNGAYYKINLGMKIEEDLLEQMLLREAKGENINIAKGLMNYITCINDLGRQDLVMKALGIHTHELNNIVSKRQEATAASLFTKHLKRPILQEYIFYIEDTAFYYDKLKKAVYSVSVAEDMQKSLNRKVYRCDFLLGKNGKVSGYEKAAWNVYYNTMKDEKYVEQQSVSQKLPDYVQEYKHKEFAEAFRFGNYTESNRNRNAIPKVLAHLERNGFENVTKNDLQFVRATRDLRDPDADYYRVNYYNPSSGKSLVYDKDGKYLYQMEYIKDHNGNIVSCNHT